MLLSLCLASLAWAGEKPEVLVVGVHLSDVGGDAATEAAKRLGEALGEKGTVKVLGPSEVSEVIRGRENLIVETFALGPGRERLREAQLFYDRAQVEDALPVAEDAVASLQRGMAVSTTIRDLLDAHVLLGMTRNALGDGKGAATSFRAAATLDVARELDPVNYPPQIIELYNAARADVAKKTPAKVSVQTSVGATIFVDGVDRGTAPMRQLGLVPGEHYVLVRAAGGAARFEAILVGPGDDRVIDAALETQALGQADDNGPGRSSQVRDLYRALGDYDDKRVVLIAGELLSDLVGIQLYSPISGNFSRALTADPGDDPIGALVDLVPTVGGYVTESGDIRADRVGAQVLSLDIGSNTVLANLLFDPPPPKERAGTVTTVVKSTVPWWIWAGTGVALAGAGATVAVVLSGSQEPEPDPADPDQGSIVFGPIP